MRVTYLKLVNVAGLYVGTGRDEIEIFFDSCINKIVSIQATNASGKTTLLSAITPFAYTTSLDERSTLNFIRNKKNGYKEIHYECDEGKIVIKHYYKPNKGGDAHSVKSYFALNGEELNENGNVTSFLSLVEMHLGITQEMMRLIRLGTNVNSFITLTTTRRKEYIGKLIDEIDLYMKMHKAVNDDLRLNRSLLTANSTSMYNCHITDETAEEDKLRSIRGDIEKCEKERDSLVGKIGRLESMIRDHNIEELRKSHQDSIRSLEELQRLEEQVREQKLSGIRVDDLIKKRSDLSDQRINTQSKINSYRISIDSAHSAIERLEASMKRIIANNDLNGLMTAIADMKVTIDQTSQTIRGFIPRNGITSDVLYRLITLLQSFNQTGQTIYSFGSKPVEFYLKLRDGNRSVDEFLRDQQKKQMSQINADDVRTLLRQMFADDVIIMPNCDTEYRECPYYRFADTITTIRDRLEEEVLDGETLRYIQVISRNVDQIENELDRLHLDNLPDKLRDSLRESVLLERMRGKKPFFALGDLQEYLSIVREHEIYLRNTELLKQYEMQLAAYKQSGVDVQLEQVQEHQKNIEFYQNNISVLDQEIQSILDQMNTVERQIALVTQYQERIKSRKIMEQTIETTAKVLEPLEHAEDELRNLHWSLEKIKDRLSVSREDYRALESRLDEFLKLRKRGEDLSQEIRYLECLQKTISTREGIPLVYMDLYLGRIQKTANSLLRIIYGDDLYLDKFNVDEDTFEIPYVKNGSKVRDVKYASQSENALMTMAISFALMNRATGRYNVLLLDEVDSGLDDENRAAFLKMLDAQMRELNAEQAFMISQNMSQLLNIPMDCIQLSDIGVRSELQNVIYQ